MSHPLLRVTDPLYRPEELEQMAEVLARFSYKEGYRFYITSRQMHLYLSIVAPVECTVTGEMVKINHNNPLEPDYFFRSGELDKDSLINYVRSCVHKMEIHEANEWLCLDGEQITPPH